MNPLDQIRSAVGTTAPWIVLTVIGSVAVFGAVALAAGMWRLRKRDVTVKSTIGLAIVQIGFSFIVITGVYDFWHKIIHDPAVESAILAVIFEAATWAGAGRIYEHGRAEVTDPRTKKLVPSTGWGLGGIVFWPATIGGAVLAVIAADGVATASGRAVIVVIGVAMWYVQLRRVTRPRGGKSLWKWTPRRFLVAIGARAADESDLQDDARSWRIAKMTRAMRWRNSFWPLSALGKRTLRKMSDTATEEEEAEAMRRYAAGWVLIDSTKLGSPLMDATVASVQIVQVAATTTARLLVPSEVGPAIGPRREPEAPVDRWRNDIDGGDESDAPVSPPVGGAGLTEMEQIQKWRLVYADAITFIKDLWRDPDGYDWATADTPPGRNEVMRVMAGDGASTGFGKWTAAGTCGRFVQVIIADRADIAGVNQPALTEGANA